MATTPASPGSPNSGPEVPVPPLVPSPGGDSEPRRVETPGVVDEGPPAYVPPSSGLGTALAVAVVVAILVAALLLLGLLPLGFLGSKGSNPGGVSATPTYDQARAAAAAAASRYGGGSSNLIRAAGLDSPIAANVTTGFTVGGEASTLACNVSLLPSVPSYTVLPAGHLNLSLGEIPAWEFYFVGGFSGILAVLVVGGTATATALLSGSVCSAVWPFLNTVSPDAVDSPEVAQNVLQAGGYSFLKFHPGSTLSLVLVGDLVSGSVRVPSNWEVTIADCTGVPLGSATPVPAFNATVGALNGTVVSTQTGNLTCPSASGPAALSLGAHGMQAPSGCDQAGLSRTGSGSVALRQMASYEMRASHSEPR